MILDAKETISRNRRIDDTLALAQVRRKLYNHTIKEVFIRQFEEVL